MRYILLLITFGKDEVPGPNPGISSIKSPSDIDAEGDFFVS